MTQSTPTQTRVLVVEDRINIAEAISAKINQNPELTVVGIAYDLAMAERLFEGLRPRMVLLDLGLPDGSGLKLLEMANAASWTCDVVVLSALGDEENVMAAFKLGAAGYLQKTDLSGDVDGYLMSVLDGGAPLSPRVARFLLRDMASQKPQQYVPKEELTAREVETLGYLSKGFKRMEIAKAMGISVGTVGVHTNRIYQKLGVRSNVEAAHVFAQRAHGDDA